MMNFASEDDDYVLKVCYTNALLHYSYLAQLMSNNLHIF